jgi:hypothetical protein
MDSPAGHGLRIFMSKNRDGQSWSSWYAEARREAKFFFDIVGVPVDAYKEQFALGKLPFDAASAISTRGLGRPAKSQERQQPQ